MTEQIPGVYVRRALLGPTMEAVDNVWMRFRDGYIDEIGTGRPPPGVRLMEGVLAMPGFVDCHVHLTMDGGPDVEAALARLGPDSAYDLALSNAAAHLQSGVTTVRDLGSFGHILLERQVDLAADQVAAPSLVAAGAVSTPGGHGHFIATLADGPEGYAQAAGDLIARGARAIKVFATGGVITAGSAPSGTQMGCEELRAVVDVAHQCGVKVAAHAHGAPGIRNAVTAAVDSIEHFSYLGNYEASQVRDSSATLVSTLVATERFVAAPDRGRARHETLEKILAHVDHEREALRRAVAERLPLAVGTDAGTTFNPHGWGMQEQAGFLAAAGMSSADALLRLTRDGAILLDEPTGWLQVGRRADLVCLDADPLADLGALRKVTGVVARGRLIEREEEAA